MPIFEYACPNCGQFELIRNHSDSEVKYCPECGESVEKLISAPATFEFKGKGFYQTDYRQSGAAVTERRSWPGDKRGNNTVNVPTASMLDAYVQFDKRRAEERRKVKKAKNRKFIAK